MIQPYAHLRVRLEGLDLHLVAEMLDLAGFSVSSKSLHSAFEVTSKDVNKNQIVAQKAQVSWADIGAERAGPDIFEMATGYGYSPSPDRA